MINLKKWAELKAQNSLIFQIHSRNIQEYLETLESNVSESRREKTLMKFEFTEKWLKDQGIYLRNEETTLLEDLKELCS